MTLFGRKYSLVNPKIVIPFFVSLDVVSLIVQGAGSGLAGSAEVVGKDVNPGGNVVVGGEFSFEKRHLSKERKGADSFFFLLSLSLLSHSPQVWLSNFWDTSWLILWQLFSL